MNDAIRARILVVDDDSGMLHTLERILGRQYQVCCAASAKEAFEQMPDFRPEIAVVDIRLPESNGFVLTRELRRRDPRLDVILMTGDTDEPDSTLLQAIDEGAFYFIHKPFDRRVLLALVGRCYELRRLRDAERRYLKTLEKELEEARTFQLSLLPPPHDELPGIEISARYLSCTQLAGDLYDYVRVDQQSTAFLIADVVGHGAPAAMLTSVVKSAFRSAQDSGYEPGAVVERVKQGLRPFDAERFVTLCCGRLDGQTGELRYVNAGHPPPLLRSAGGEVRQLETTGPLLSSAFGHIDHGGGCELLVAGDGLFVYTDGVTETPASRDGAWYGSQRLGELISANAARGPELLDSVLASLDEYSGGRARPDDVTMLSIDYRGMAEVVPEEAGSTVTGV